MKFNKIFSLAALFCVSCSGFLNENPTTIIDRDVVFTTESTLEAQAMGCLNAFYGVGMYNGEMNEVIHTGSGLMVWKGARDGNEHLLSGLNFAKYSSNTTTASCYAQHYNAISRCNYLIQGLKNSPVDEAYKNEIEGEARFYRAVLYFTLVRLFGDVPLVVTPPATLQELNVPRSPYYKVYDQIIKDLDFAELNMRTPERVAEIGFSNRVNKWAATSYKSAVYAYIASILDHQDDNFFDNTKPERLPDFSEIGITDRTQAWTKCLENAENVIQNGPYKLCPNFGQLFRWTNPEDWTLDERIFCLASTDNINVTNYLATRSLPLCPEGSMEVDKNGNKNYGRFRPSRFFFQEWCRRNKGTKGSGNAANIYVSCPDPRLNLSLFHTQYYHLGDQVNVTIYPNASRVLNSSVAYCLPYYKKYLDPTYASTSGRSDLYMMRFAEVYYFAAEAAAELSETVGDTNWEKALGYVEVVHARARKSVTPEASMPSWAANTFANKDDLTEAIFWDRSFELCGEGHEWFETHRHGAKWLKYVIAEPYNDDLEMPENEKIFTEFYHSTLAPTEVQTLRKSLMCAFPQEEMNYNTAISMEDQNDFYWN